MVENDNRRVKRRPLVRELKVECCRLQVGDDGWQRTKSYSNLVGYSRIYSDDAGSSGQKEPKTLPFLYRFLYREGVGWLDSVGLGWTGLD